MRRLLGIVVLKIEDQHFLMMMNCRPEIEEVPGRDFAEDESAESSVNWAHDLSDDRSQRAMIVF